MGHKIITEKDYWQCTGGMMPTPFQGQQKIAKKAGGEKYIVKTDLSTISYVDFGCKKIMLLYAVIAAIVAVAACLIVATGGLALVLIAAGAGAAGAVYGAAIGTLICGQQAAAARVWLSYKSNFKILGIETITGGDKMQCNAFTFLGMSPEFVTFNPQIKNWAQAIKMGAASFLANVLQGAMTGMMIGAAAVALPALLEGGTAAFMEGGVLNTMRFLGSNVIKNYAASWLTGEGLLLRGAITAQSGLEGYGQRGEVTGEDIGKGAFGMELGTAQSLKNIASGSTNPLDYIGVALWFTPVGQMRKGNEESRGGEREKSKEESEKKNKEASRGSESEKRNDSKGEKDAYESGLGKFEGDPARDYYGSGKSSHPAEWEAIISQLKSEGVEVVYRKGTLAYEPGNPGRIIIDPDASYSALRHEYQHYTDNKANGGPGIGYYMENPQARIDMETKAYDVEIEMAKKQGNTELANHLEELKQNEINYIKENFMAHE